MFNEHVTRTGLATLFRLNFFYSTIFIMFTSTVAKAESIVSTTKAMGGKGAAVCILSLKTVLEILNKITK